MRYTDDLLLVAERNVTGLELNASCGLSFQSSNFTASISDISSALKMSHSSGSKDEELGNSSASLLANLRVNWPFCCVAVGHCSLLEEHDACVCCVAA